ncbi:MAG: acyl carrier protein [Actinomadura sp.]
MPSTEADHADLRAELVRIVADIKSLPFQQITPDRDWPLTELGLDSLDLVELSVRLDRNYGIELGTHPEDFVALASLCALTELVAQRRRR